MGPPPPPTPTRVECAPKWPKRVAEGALGTQIVHLAAPFFEPDGPKRGPYVYPLNGHRRTAPFLAPIGAQMAPIWLEMSQNCSQMVPKVAETHN